MAAIEKAADLANVPLSDDFVSQVAEANEKRRKMLAEIEAFELEMWSDDHGKGLKYLTRRGITHESIIEFRLGYDPDRNCIVLPAIDRSGVPLGYFTRYISPRGDMKYHHRNTMWYKKGAHLYNSRSLFRDCTAYIAEGPFDVISIQQLDVGPVVGVNGSAITEQQIATIRTLCKNVVLVADAAKENDFRLLRKNVERIRDGAPDVGVSVVIPPGDDANASDPEDLRVALQSPVAPEGALLDLVVHGETEDQYARARSYVSTIPDILVRDDIIKKLAERWGKPVDIVRQALINVSGSTGITPLTVEEAMDLLHEDITLAKQQCFVIDWPGLHGYTKRLRSRHIVEVWARPGVGKTMGLLNMLRRTAGNFGQVYFSLEQPASEIINRLLIMTSWDLGAPLSQDDLDHIIDTDPEKYDFYRSLMGTYYEYTRIIDNRVTTEQMRSTLSDMALTSAVPMRVVWIDYLGLIKDEENMDEYPRVSKAFYDLQEMAKEFNVLMVIAHQVSRKAGSGHQPLTLDAGRGSGVGEEVADLIVGLYRPDQDDDVNLGERRIIADVLKNRHGPVGRAIWGFGLQSLRLESRTIS